MVCTETNLVFCACDGCGSCINHKSVELQGTEFLEDSHSRFKSHYQIHKPNEEGRANWSGTKECLGKQMMANEERLGAQAMRNARMAVIDGTRRSTRRNPIEPIEGLAISENFYCCCKCEDTESDRPAKIVRKVQSIKNHLREDHAVTGQDMKDCYVEVPLCQQLGKGTCWFVVERGKGIQNQPVVRTNSAFTSDIGDRVSDIRQWLLCNADSGRVAIPQDDAAHRDTNEVGGNGSEFDDRTLERMLLLNKAVPKETAKRYHYLAGGQSSTGRNTLADDIAKVREQLHPIIYTKVSRLHEEAKSYKIEMRSYIKGGSDAADGDAFRPVARKRP